MNPTNWTTGFSGLVGKYEDSTKWDLRPKNRDLQVSQGIGGFEANTLLKNIQLLRGAGSRAGFSCECTVQ